MSSKIVIKSCWSFFTLGGNHNEIRNNWTPLTVPTNLTSPMRHWFPHRSPECERGRSKTIKLSRDSWLSEAVWPWSDRSLVLSHEYYADWALSCRCRDGSCGWRPSNRILTRSEQLWGVLLKDASDVRAQRGWMVAKVHGKTLFIPRNTINGSTMPPSLPNNSAVFGGDVHFVGEVHRYVQWPTNNKDKRPVFLLLFLTMVLLLTVPLGTQKTAKSNYPIRSAFVRECYVKEIPITKMAQSCHNVGFKLINTCSICSLISTTCKRRHTFVINPNIVQTDTSKFSEEWKCHL